MFYLNTIEQLFHFVEQLEVRSLSNLLYSRLLTGIPILAVLQNLRWNSNKTLLPLCLDCFKASIDTLVANFAFNLLTNECKCVKLMS